jgi:hypothetical protein
MTTLEPDQAPTIDMTLDGRVIAPPTFWTRAREIWRVLPRGSVPVILGGLVLLALAAIFVVGVLIVAVPVILALAVIGLIVRASHGPPGAARPPTRR